MKGFSIFKRVVSLIVVVCFLTTNAMAMPAQTLGATLNAQRSTDLLTLPLPSSLGNIVETYTAPRATGHEPRTTEKPRGSGDVDRKTVIYIQDAHDSLEAQENIAEMVRWLVKDYGVKTVYEEGYEGPVPTDELFGRVKDPVLKEKIAYYLMDKLRVGGAEYAHINRRSRLDHRPQTTAKLTLKAVDHGLWTMDGNGSSWAPTRSRSTSRISALTNRPRRTAAA